MDSFSMEGLEVGDGLWGELAGLVGVDIKLLLRVLGCESVGFGEEDFGLEVMSVDWTLADGALRATRPVIFERELLRLSLIPVSER